MSNLLSSVYVSSILFDSLVQKGMSFNNWLQQLLSLGIHGVEIREQHLGFPGWDQNEVIRALSKRPYTKTTFATNFRLDDVMNATKRKNLLLQMDFVSSINARIIRVFPPSSRLNEKEMALFSEIITKASNKELVLVVENTAQENLAKFKKIMDDFSTKAIGVTFDTGNAVLAKEDPVQMFKELREKIKYVPSL